MMMTPVFVTLSALVAPEDMIHTGSLLQEMYDLDKFAYSARLPYKTVQFSSYDRQSAVPGGEGWFANNDGFGGEQTPNFEGVIREPGEDGVGEYVICDVEGPGAIVRTWTPANEGRIRVYLDGAAQPVFDGPAEEFLNAPWTGYAEEAGLDASLLEGTLYQRDAAYCPMPFRTRCRIEWEGRVAGLHFYHIQIRRYDKTAQVAPFHPAQLAQLWPVVEQTARFLREPGKWVRTQRMSAANYAETEIKREDGEFETELAPDGRGEGLVLEGDRVITELALQVSPLTDKALRGTLLSISFDGAAWPQAQSPVGDFFGAAPGVNPYESLPFTVDEDGWMTCRFPMPFAKSARVAFHNTTDENVTVKGRFEAYGGQWRKTESAHFHARWRIDHGVTGDPAHPQDIPYLLVNGRGVFAGAAAYIMNPNPVPSSGGNWWGEGDEKIFVDADQRPSTFGTGSEDYFNYGWSQNDIFYHPYCGQPRNDGPANRGHVTNFRWHILDPLPFRQRLAFYMELLPHERTKGMSYARMTYYYAAPGGYDDHMAISPADARAPEVPLYEPAARGAAANARFVPAKLMIADPQRGDLAFPRQGPWSEYAVIWTAEPGESLTLYFEIEETGPYFVRAALGLMPGGARISASLDGQPLQIAGQEVCDLSRPARTMVRCLPIYDGQLEAGSHELTVTSRGEEGGYVPIDYLWLEPR